MKTYIVNLTNDLIGKHGLDHIYDSMLAQSTSGNGKEEFVKFVNVTISSSDVRTWSPETLGKVMCSFEDSELPAINLGFFFGDTKQHLRNVVSLFLSYSICSRMQAARGKSWHIQIPPYVSKKTATGVVDPGFKAIVDSLAGKKVQKVNSTEDAVRLTVSTGLLKDDLGVMPEVLAYLKKNPGNILEYGMQIQDAYSTSDRRTPIVKMVLALKSALQ